MLVKLRSIIFSSVSLCLIFPNCHLIAADEGSLEALKIETELLEMQYSDTLSSIQRTLEQCDDVANATLTELADQSETLNSIERACVKTRGKLLESKDLAGDMKRGPFLNFFYRLFVPYKSKRWKRPKLSQKGIGHQKIGYMKMLRGGDRPKKNDLDADHDEVVLSQIEHRLESLKEKAALMGEELNYHSEKINQVDDTLEDNNDRIDLLGRRIRR